MLAGSSGSDAISMQQKDASFVGAIVATGGVVIGSMNSTYTGTSSASRQTLGGSSDTLDGPKTTSYRDASPAECDGR